MLATKEDADTGLFRTLARSGWALTNHRRSMTRKSLPESDVKWTLVAIKLPVAELIREDARCHPHAF